MAEQEEWICGDCLRTAPSTDVRMGFAGGQWRVYLEGDIAVRARVEPGYEPTVTEALAILRMWDTGDGHDPPPHDQFYTREEVHAFIREHGTVQECEAITPTEASRNAGGSYFCAGCGSDTWNYKREGFEKPRRHYWHDSCLERVKARFKPETPEWVKQQLRDAAAPGWVLTDEGPDFDNDWLIGVRHGDNKVTRYIAEDPRRETTARHRVWLLSSLWKLPDPDAPAPEQRITIGSRVRIVWGCSGGALGTVVATHNRDGRWMVQRDVDVGKYRAIAYESEELELVRLRDIEVAEPPPDANCKTLPDGSCEGTGCMHEPEPEPEPEPIPPYGGNEIGLPLLPDSLRPVTFAPPLSWCGEPRSSCPFEGPHVHVRNGIARRGDVVTVPDGTDEVPACTVGVVESVRIGKEGAWVEIGIAGRAGASWRRKRLRWRVFPDVPASAVLRLQGREER